MVESDKQMVEAFIDGEIPSSKMEDVKHKIYNDEKLRQYYSLLIHQKTLLNKWWIQQKHKSH